MWHACRNFIEQDLSLEAKDGEAGQAASTSLFFSQVAVKHSISTPFQPHVTLALSPSETDSARRLLKHERVAVVPVGAAVLGRELVVVLLQQRRGLLAIAEFLACLRCWWATQRNHSVSILSISCSNATFVT